MDSRSRRQGQGASHQAAPGAGLAARARGFLPLAAGAVLVIGAGLWFGGLFPGGGSSSPNVPAAAMRDPHTTPESLPQFIADAPDRVREAYAFAATAGADLVYIPCYCGCGEHSGHRYVLDCFIKHETASGIEYDSHGSGCDVCVGIVLDAKQKLAEGQTLSQVRRFIDAKWSSAGPGTNTPLPPEGVQ